MPQKAAGRMTEPIVCVPRARGQKPAATAAAEPLLEPPGVCARLYGLRVGPGSAQANSVETVLPRMMAPAERNALTQVASAPANNAGGSCAPARVGKPSTLNTSLMPRSTPYNAGRLAGSGKRSCKLLASASRRVRRSGSGRRALICGSSASMRWQMLSIKDARSS